MGARKPAVLWGGVQGGGVVSWREWMGRGGEGGEAHQERGSKIVKTKRGKGGRIVVMVGGGAVW